MAYKFQVGSFTASGSIKAESGFDAGDSNVANVGDIDADSISVADAANGLDIDGSGANNGTFKISMKDGGSAALDIMEGSNSYLKFDTTDSAEVIVASKKVRLADDTKLAFGASDDASFEYDEDGTDTLLYSGASLRIGDDIKLEFGAAGDAAIEYDEDGTDQLRIHAPSAGVVIGGTTPTLVIGDGGEEDNKIVFDGHSGGQDYYIGLDDTDDDLKIGLGNAVGSNTAITLNGDANVTMAGNLTVSGDLTVDGDTVTVNVATITVEDKNIHLAKGATGNGARGAGLDIELGGDVDRGFIRVGATDDSIFELQAPGATIGHVLTIDMDAAGEIEFGAAKKLTVAGNFNIDADITSTAGEINLLDGDVAVGSSITLADADGIIVDDDGTSKKIPVSDFKTYIGAGTLNVASGSSGAVSTINKGVNYYNQLGAATNAALVTGSSLTVGDVLYIKAGPDCSSTNTLTVAAAGSDSIDGTEDHFVLESPNAAVTLIYVAEGDFRIF